MGQNTLIGAVRDRAKLLLIIRRQQQALETWQKATLQARRDLQATLAAVLLAEHDGVDCTDDWNQLFRTACDDVARLEELIV